MTLAELCRGRVYESLCWIEHIEMSSPHRCQLAIVVVWQFLLAPLLPPNGSQAKGPGERLSVDGRSVSGAV